MKKITLLTTIFILILGLSSGIYIFSHIGIDFSSNYERWQQIPNAKISKNGELSPSSRVYESSEGDYLVVVRGSRFGSAKYFIIYTKSNNVGLFSSSSVPFEVLGDVLVPKNRGNVMLASNEKLPAKLKLNERQIEIIGTEFETKWQILACLKDCESG